MNLAYYHGWQILTSFHLSRIVKSRELGYRMPERDTSFVLYFFSIQSSFSFLNFYFHAPAHQGYAELFSGKTALRFRYVFCQLAHFQLSASNFFYARFSFYVYMFISYLETRLIHWKRYSSFCGFICSWFESAGRIINCFLIRYINCHAFRVHI